MNPSLEAWARNPLGGPPVNADGEEWIYEVQPYDTVRRADMESKRYTARQLLNGKLLKAKVCDNELAARQQCRAWERCRQILFEVSPYRPLGSVIEIGRPIADLVSPLDEVKVDHYAPLD